MVHLKCHRIINLSNRPKNIIYSHYDNQYQHQSAINFVKYFFFQLIEKCTKLHLSYLFVPIVKTKYFLTTLSHRQTQDVLIAKGIVIKLYKPYLYG